MDGTAIKAMMAELAPVIREYVGAQFAVLEQRLSAVEQRPAPERGEKGEAGEPGAAGVGVAEAVRGDGVVILRLTDGAEVEIKDGEKGQDAEPLSPEAVAEVFRPMAKEIVSEAVAEGIAKMPPPEKGEKGDQGQPGADGANGCGIADLLVDRDGNLIASLEDGRMKNLGPICGKDGQDGRDGFSLEDFDIEAGEDGRTATLKFERGDIRHSYELVFPVIVYRDVFKAGETYQAGDAVTWGGSLWIAQRETDAKPDSADSGFRLAVKKGRDGKDAK